MHGVWWYYHWQALSSSPGASFCRAGIMHAPAPRDTIPIYLCGERMTTSSTPQSNAIDAPRDASCGRARLSTLTVPQQPGFREEKLPQRIEVVPVFTVCVFQLHRCPPDSRPRGSGQTRRRWKDERGRVGQGS